MLLRILRAMSSILCAAGIILLVWPYFMDFCFKIQTKKVIEDFNASVMSESVSVPDIGIDRNEISLDVNVLYRQMKIYNERIYEERQSGMADPEGFEVLPEELTCIDDNAVGYVEIPSIDVKLPLYVGTTEENLAKGAAVLSNTSMPIGGKNTNCVIAAHRGYYSSKYFKDIEQVKLGDIVLVTNPWETRTYTVIDFDVIEPSDENAIKIQEGRELVTLLTCHPYRGNGKYRYIVFCEPVLPSDNQNTDEKGNLNGEKILSEQKSLEYPDGTDFRSSVRDIHNEEIIRRICVIILVIVLTINFIISAGLL